MSTVEKSKDQNYLLLKQYLQKVVINLTFEINFQYFHCHSLVFQAPHTMYIMCIKQTQIVN